MDHREVENAVARKSAATYIPLSLGAGFTFLLAATLVGNYTTVAKIGGALWVGLLSLIVSMPIVTSRVKKRWRGRL